MNVLAKPRLHLPVSTNEKCVDISVTVHLKLGHSSQQVCFLKTTEKCVPTAKEYVSIFLTDTQCYQKWNLDLSRGISRSTSDGTQIACRVCNKNVSVLVHGQSIVLKHFHPWQWRKKIVVIRLRVHSTWRISQVIQWAVEQDSMIRCLHWPSLREHH